MWEHSLCIIKFVTLYSAVLEGTVNDKSRKANTEKIPITVWTEK